MNVQQIYDLVNPITKEILGDSVVLNEDLSNVVEVGGALSNTDMDNYVNKLVDRIGKTVVVSKKFNGFLASLMMEGWEFGSVLQRIRVSLPEAEENDVWSLVDGASYDTNIYRSPEVTAEYFNKKLTFDVEMSFTRRQLKESFVSPESLNVFITGIREAIENSMIVKISGVAQRALNNMIGLTLYDEYNSTSTFNNASHIKAVNLLYEYNTANSTNLTATEALTTEAFLKYASYRMGQYYDRLTKPSKLFNINGYSAITKKEDLAFILHSDFERSANVYLYSDIFHDEYVKLPAAETIPYFQGSGTGYAFADTSKIMVTTTDSQTMTMTGIVGVMCDRTACAVCNPDKYVTSNYNAKGDFINEYYHYDCELINDKNENFVVFFLA